MTTYLPSQINRKKKTEGRYDPDTFRVVSDEAEKRNPKYEKPAYTLRFGGEPDEITGTRIRNTRVLPHPMPDHRANKPHPGACNFLRHDVHLLNEPVCAVHTRETHPMQNRWWPPGDPESQTEMPPYSYNTTSRTDYTFSKDKALPPLSRHSANFNKEPALGAVPVNFLRSRDGKKRFYKEGLSYEHQYNSRLDPNYPIRGKRHGSFVWDAMHRVDADKFISNQSHQQDEDNLIRKQGPHRNASTIGQIITMDTQTPVYSDEKIKWLPVGSSKSKTSLIENASETKEGVELPPVG